MQWTWTVICVEWDLLEVIAVINSFIESKSTRQNDILIHILKLCKNVLSPFLEQIFNLCMKGGNIVQWCSRDRNLQDRDLAQISRPRLCHKNRDQDLEVRDRDSRPHISLMVIKANSLNNAVTKYLAHYHPKFVQTAKYCKGSFSLSS